MRWSWICDAWRAKAEVASAVPASPRLERRPRRWGLVAGIAAAIVLVAAGVTWQLWERDYFWQNPLANARSERVTDFDGEEVDAAISPDGKFTVFVSDRDGPFDVWVSQIGTGEPVNITKGQFQLPVSDPIRAAGFSGDGAKIYSATAEDGSGQWLYAIDVEHRIPHRVSSGIAEQYLSVAVDEARPRRLVTTIAAPTASLWTVPISDGIETEAATKPGPSPNSRALGPQFARDYLAFLSSKGGANGLWKLENGASRELWRGDDGGVVAPPAISPDGRQICFSYRKQGRAGLYIMNANGTNVRALASFDVRGAASWSPDGKWVAVAANQGEGSRLFKIPVDGGQPVRLLDTLSYNPVWSPDGRLIVYSEPQGGGLFEVKAITPDPAPVAIPPLQVSFAIGTAYRFMPNGKALVFLGGTLRAQNFFRLDLESGQQRQLTDLKAGFVIQNFDVSQDGKQIVFDRLRNNADIVLMNLAR